MCALTTLIRTCRWLRAADNLLEKATVKRIESRTQGFEQRKEAYQLLFRYVDYYSVLQKHKDSGLPRHAPAKQEFQDNVRFALPMAEDLKAELRVEAEGRFARGIIQERERRKELAKRSAEPEPEPEQEPEQDVKLAASVSLPKGVPAPAIDTVRNLVGAPVGGRAAVVTPAAAPVEPAPRSLYGTLKADVRVPPMAVPSVGAGISTHGTPSEGTPPVHDATKLPAYGDLVQQQPMPQNLHTQDPALGKSGQIPAASSGLPEYSKVAKVANGGASANLPPGYSDVAKAPAPAASTAPSAVGSAGSDQLVQRPQRQPQPQPQPHTHPTSGRQGAPSCDCGVECTVRTWRKKDGRHGQTYYACAKQICKFQQFQGDFQAESRAWVPPPVRQVAGGPAPTPVPVPAPAPAPPPPVQPNPIETAPVRVQPQRVRTRRPQQAQALVGLKNLGNTCYMNACIQCLSHTFELSSVFRRIEDSDLNKTSVVGSRGVLATEFANLIRRIWSSPPNSVEVPSSLKKQIGKLNETFAGFAQQDSQELLRFLLDGLHEDLNRVRQKPKWYELEDIDGESDEQKAERYWQYNVERNSSPVGDLFAGQLMSELVCGQCQRRSTCFDPCWDVSVQLDARVSACRLEACLDAFVAPEILKGDDSIYCARCKKLTTQRKKLAFSRLPRVLVVHLKRFEQVCFSRVISLQVAYTRLDLHAATAHRCPHVLARLPCICCLLYLVKLEVSCASPVVLQHRKLPTNVHFPMEEQRLEMTKYLVGRSRETYSYRLRKYLLAAGT